MCKLCACCDAIKLGLKSLCVRVSVNATNEVVSFIHLFCLACLPLQSAAVLFLLFLFFQVFCVDFNLWNRIWIGNHPNALVLLFSVDACFVVVLVFLLCYVVLSAIIVSAVFAILLFELLLLAGVGFNIIYEYFSPHWILSKCLDQKCTIKDMRVGVAPI